MHALDGRAHAHDLLLTQAFSFTLTARVRALSISLPPSYKRSQTLSFSCFGLQAKAWKAGHKRECEEAKWLQAAFDGGHKSARLHLAHLAFTAGEEDTALARLKEHLSWCVQDGRDTCAGCGQVRGVETQMLTCGGCRVARFCSADHQKMASRKGASHGRHKDLCGVLCTWR